MAAVCHAQNLQRETCDARRFEVDVGVSSSQALIGGLFEVRNPIMGGYACGQPHKGTVPDSSYIIVDISIILCVYENDCSSEFD